MGQKHAGPTHTHVEATRYKVDKDDLIDVHIKNTTVQYSGRDQYLNHWICVTPNADEDSTELIIDNLRVKLQEEYAANVEGFTPFDPLQHFFTGTSIKCRLAKTGNFMIHENAKSDERDKNKVLYERHEITTKKNIEQEEKCIRDIIEGQDNEGAPMTYSFDVDISFAGALICPEGPLASVVCRKLFRCVDSERVCDEIFTKLNEEEEHDTASAFDC